MKASLFLGIPLAEELSKQLEATPQTLKSLFIRDDPNYLQIITHRGRQYIGKFADPRSALAQLDQLETNIQTLLIKLIPSYSHDKSSSFLLPTS